MKSWRTDLPPVILAASLLAVYLRTLAPGLSWANQGADGGDLITAAATGGIAHPTGYPLYLLLARLFQLLPVGSLAYRTNLLSAVFTVLACLLIYAIVVRYLSGSRRSTAALAGLAAGYCYGLAPLVWSQAVITEVYALQGFLLAGIVYLYSGPTPASAAGRKSLDRWRGLALGLGLCNQVTTLLLVPLALVLGASHRSGPRKEQIRSGGYTFDTAALGRQLLWLLVGLSLYLVLPIRALSGAPVLWGNPFNLGRLWWLVSGRLYQDVYLQLALSHVWRQAGTWLDFTVGQVGVIAILLGALGLLLFGKWSRLEILTAGAAITSLAFTLIYRSADAAVYLLPLLISLSIWLGLGVSGLADRLFRRSHALGLSTLLLTLGIVLIRPAFYVQQLDASQDRRAESFGRQVLSTVPANAILFVTGDKAIFALWYFHFTLHQRSDLAVLAAELLPYDWYREGLSYTYPALSLPGPFLYTATIARANPLRPICYVQYTDQAEIQCTSSLAASR